MSSSLSTSSNIDEAVDFYSKLFATEPAKVRPGYANFAIADPPLKLVLIENASPGRRGRSTTSASRSRPPRGRCRPDPAGRRRTWPTAVEEQVTCCYAVQDKVWVDGPGGEPWEIYTVLADAEMPAGELRSTDPAGAACCATPA